MEVIEKRSTEGGKVDPEPIQVWGSRFGFCPAYNRVLIRRFEAVQQGAIISPDAYTELAERGEVIAFGECDIPAPPLGSVATFSKYGAEEKHFDDEDGNKFVLVWVHDVRGWHAAD